MRRPSPGRDLAGEEGLDGGGGGGGARQTSLILNE